MKKFLFLLISVLIAAGFTACRENAPECKFHTLTLDLEARQAGWQFDEKQRQFYYHFNVPQITPYIYNYGNWTICREYNYGSTDPDYLPYQVALPQSVFVEEKLNDSTSVYFTQHIDYRLGVEFVEIQLTNSDFLYLYDEAGKIINPEAMYFRLQLIY